MVLAEVHRRKKCEHVIYFFYRKEDNVVAADLNQSSAVKSAVGPQKWISLELHDICTKFKAQV